MNTTFTLYTATVTGQQTNTRYPNKHTITSENTLKTAARFDHVAAEYQGSMRSASGYIASDCLVMDIDNDHSENPAEWVTPENLSGFMPEVEFYTATSRSHLKPKGTVTARPRFHLYLPIRPVTSASEYAGLKKKLAERYSFFDPNAVDAARFLYGNPDTSVTYHPGELLIDDLLIDKFAEFDAASGQIPEGSRNSTLSRFAGRILKRLGATVEARAEFDKRASWCNPPLPAEELEQIWRSALGFAARAAADPNYIPPDEYDAEAGLRPHDFTEVGQAIVFATEYSHRVCYSPATGWMAYDGGIWEENEPKVQYAAQELTARQLEQAQEILDEKTSHAETLGVLQLLDAHSKTKAIATFNPKQATAYGEMEAARAWLQFVHKCRSDKSINAVMRQARPLTLINPENLDTDPYLLNTPSGTFDLRDGRKREHKPSDLLTKQTSLEPAQHGMDTWLAALETIFEGDQEVIGYVQRVCGLAAIGKVLIEALIIAYGDGNNGKSTFWNTIARVLGSYAETISAEVLIAGKKNNAKHDMAETRARRLLIAGENDEGVRLSTSFTKQLASTDKIAAEKKYKDPFSFTPSHTLVLYTNHLPKVGASDTGIWRRLIVIPFTATIKPDKDIKNYADHLYEKAGGAVLAWIMEGSRLIHAENYKLNPPAKVVAASAAYREANDWFAHFLDERCEKGDGFEDKSQAVYDAYRAWAGGRGDYVRSAADFYAAVEKAGFGRRRTRPAKLITGLRLINEFNLQKRKGEKGK